MSDGKTIYVDREKYEKGMKECFNKKLQPGMNHCHIGDKVRSISAGYRGRIKEIQYTAPLQAVVEWEDCVDNGGTSTIQLHLLELVPQPDMGFVRRTFDFYMCHQANEMERIKVDIYKAEAGHNRGQLTVLKAQLELMNAQLRALKKVFGECDLDIRDWATDVKEEG